MASAAEMCAIQVQENPAFSRKNCRFSKNKKLYYEDYFNIEAENQIRISKSTKSCTSILKFPRY
jgi:hypothetical protein